MNTEKMNNENNLAQARRQKGLSQEDVAEALDVSRQAVSRWETGIPQTLIKILVSHTYMIESCPR